MAAALALHIIPEPDVVVQGWFVRYQSFRGHSPLTGQCTECIRVLQPGGIFGATTFAAANSTQWFVRDLDTAFASLPIQVPRLVSIPMQMHNDGDWTDAKWIELHLTKLGLQDVIARESPGSHRFESAEDWMTTFEGMMNWMMSLKWDEETRKKMPAAEVKAKVLHHLREKYNEGGWDVDWTTIVMTGRVPERK